jgi:hypothetical protein
MRVSGRWCQFFRQSFMAARQVARRLTAQPDRMVIASPTAKVSGR